MGLKAVASLSGASFPLLDAGALLVNGLGDSITAQSVYQSADFTPTNVPAWAASTAYVVGNVVLNDSGKAYSCTQAGTSASSGGPTGTGASITDNGCKWQFLGATVTRRSTSYLSCIEAFSLGRLIFDMSQGYAGLQNSLAEIRVVQRGSGYSSGDTITLNNSATATLNVNPSDGGIDSVTITQPGYNATTAFTYSISTSTGSGAQITLIHNPSGTFAVPGCQTRDMVARLPDVLASTVDVVFVMGGTNDVSAGVGYATITANLDTIFQTLTAAKKYVAAYTITPRKTGSDLTSAQRIVMMRVNRWLRAYARCEPWANPNRTRVGLADPVPYCTDGADLVGGPIGGVGGVANAVTLDGLHPSPRGAQIYALLGIQALAPLIGQLPTYRPRTASMFDGYDPTANPGGNLLEGLPWAASAAYSLIGMLVVNDSGKLYRLVQAGTSASSGGPTGTGTGIVDGGCKWNYVSAAGQSVFAAGSSAIASSLATGVTGSGVLGTGWSISRTAGSASGTVAGAIENPWSDNHAGNRQSLAFTLGSGTVNEQWLLALFNGSLPLRGVSSADLGTTYLVAEMEIEVSGVANLSQIALFAGQDTSNRVTSVDGLTNATLVQGNQMMSSADMLPYPNGGKLLRRTQPFLMPSYQSNLNYWLTIGFDASGGASSATLTLKINHVSLRKAFS